MKNPSAFKDYSKYYDLLYREKNYATEAKYILNLFRIHGKNSPNTILELGSGTCKHAIQFATFGHSLTCVEISKQMQSIAIQNIAKTNAKIAKKIDLIQSDARKFKSKKKFDAAISLFHVINYQSNNSDLLAFLKTAHTHLKKNSLFIFDFWYGPGVLTDLPGPRKKEAKNEELSILRNTTSKLIFEKNICEVSFDIKVHNLVKKTTFQLKERHPMRYLFLPEIELLAKECGFDFIAAHEWMKIKPISGTPFNAAAVLRKK